METGLDNALNDSPEHLLSGLAFSLPITKSAESRSVAPADMTCFHCGEPCRDTTFAKADKLFCCQGCLVVHDLLAESGLGQFYELSRHPGVRIQKSYGREEWAYLDDPTVQMGLLDFTDGAISRVTFYVPAIHCVACVWLLENGFRLHAGVGACQVNFPRREATFYFDPRKIALSELAALLAGIGYKPQITLGELDKPVNDPTRKKQWLQVGIAGFAFGNIMLFSLPVYLGLDSLSGPLFRALFGYLSLALAIPVVIYSASDYWRSAFLSLRQRVLTLDVPIALGLVALYAQSAYDIVRDCGAGYLDSLAGLVFFLLCGRVFQQKTHERMAFDLDYKFFFPLAVTRKNDSGEEIIPLSNLRVGDRLLIRNGELVPADARLVSGPALIDYSFVTGESEPVIRSIGDYLYAGGQQAGAAIEVETLKPVSQSYLTSLWSDQVFTKDRRDDLNTLTNRYSRRFTRLVIIVAISAAMFWIFSGDPARGIKTFASVLIVACPCALALAAPFALGTSQRLLARMQVFLKNAFVLERLARVATIVFDKTGTLTAGQGSRVTFFPASECERNPFHKSRADLASCAQASAPKEEMESGSRLNELSAEEASWVCSLTAQSTHPHAIRIREWLRSMLAAEPISSFNERPGLGISGLVQAHSICLGSRGWLENSGVLFPEFQVPLDSSSYLAIDGKFRGTFCFSHLPRAETDRLINELGSDYELILLSGDNDRESESYRQLFGPKAFLHFNQTPHDKLEFVRRLQASGKTIMMVGDGLNDAGALKQSDVGIAVVERVGVFSPASDVIVEAAQVPRLFRVLTLARRTVRVVRWSFGISATYNLVGISIAAAGVLSPLICAVLMPLSSLSVVLFACGMSNWAARAIGLTKP